MIHTAYTQIEIQMAGQFLPINIVPNVDHEVKNLYLNNDILLSYKARVQRINYVNDRKEFLANIPDD